MLLHTDDIEVYPLTDDSRGATITARTSSGVYSLSLNFSTNTCVFSSHNEATDILITNFFMFIGDVLISAEQAYAMLSEILEQELRKLIQHYEISTYSFNLAGDSWMQ